MEPTFPTQNRKARPQFRGERIVPFGEMQRLMRVYGSTKCLRKRQSPDGGTDAKCQSVKRKFYRWFPDLDERFDREEDTGRFVPKIGHEAEVRYREEMRANDGKLLAEKRAKCMKKKKSGKKVGKVSAAKVEGKAAAVSPAPVLDDARLTSSSLDAERGERKAVVTDIEFDIGLGLAAGAADEEPFEDSFFAERHMFDVDSECLLGPFPPRGDVPARRDHAPPITWSSCSSGSLEEERGSSGLSGSWEMSSASIEDMLDGTELTSIKDMVDKTIEECCEEILGLEDDGDAVSLPCWAAPMVHSSSIELRDRHDV